MAGTIGRGYLGTAVEPIPLESLRAIWDAMFAGVPLAGHTQRYVPRAYWEDASGVSFEAKSWDDLRAAYEGRSAKGVTFVGFVKDAGHRELHYALNRPPSARAEVWGEPHEVEGVLDVVRQLFPNPVRRVVFLSWSGASAKKLAEALQPIVKERVPAGVDVFLSSSLMRGSGIPPGAEPMSVLRENLLQTEVTLAVSTHDGAKAPWLVWEAAATWAQGKLVIPLSAGIEPTKAAAPLQALHQVVRLEQRDDVDAMLHEVTERLGAPAPTPITDEQMASLERAALRRRSERWARRVLDLLRGSGTA